MTSAGTEAQTLQHRHRAAEAAIAMHAAQAMQHMPCSTGDAAQAMQHMPCSTGDAAHALQHTHCSTRTAAHALQLVSWWQSQARSVWAMAAPA